MRLLCALALLTTNGEALRGLPNRSIIRAQTQNTRGLSSDTEITDTEITVNQTVSHSCSITDKLRVARLCSDTLTRSLFTPHRVRVWLWRVGAVGSAFQHSQAVAAGAVRYGTSTRRDSCSRDAGAGTGFSISSRLGPLSV